MNPISIFESISITVILIMDQFIKNTKGPNYKKSSLHIHARIIVNLLFNHGRISFGAFATSAPPGNRIFCKGAPPETDVQVRLFNLISPIN